MPRISANLEKFRELPRKMTKNAREFSREFYKNSPRISVGLGTVLQNCIHTALFSKFEKLVLPYLERNKEEAKCREREQLVRELFGRVLFWILIRQCSTTTARNNLHARHDKIEKSSHEQNKAGCCHWWIKRASDTDRHSIEHCL